VFVIRARSLGLSLAEIRELVALRRTGWMPCPEVRALARRKLARLDRELAELIERRDRLRDLVAGRPPRSGRTAAVCPAIECPDRSKSIRRRRR
jgi:DNA-binding transcriptional MerR regulator